MKDSTSPPEESPTSMGRRAFLVGASALGAALTLPGGAFATGDGRVAVDPWLRGPADRLIPSTPDVTRRWLGPHLWGNRLQDWRYDRGRVECLRGDAGHELRTASLLTRELVPGDEPAHLRVRTGVLDDAESATPRTDDGGFCGFLVGVGGGELDYRAAALAQRSSGVGGGLLCTYETDGRVRFRDHTDEENPVSYDELPPDDTLEPDASADPASNEAVRLSLDALPRSDGRFSVVLKALDDDSGALVSGAVRDDVPRRKLRGGIALVSSPYPDRDGARWWFDRLETGGAKIAERPGRTFDPIVGTLFSVADSVLKLSAQLVPLGDADPETVRLRYRPVDGTNAWQSARTSLGRGYTALFRIEGWDASRAWEYRVVYRDASGEAWTYGGRIPEEPNDPDELTVGLLGCTNPCMRRLDSPRPRSKYPDVSIPGRHTSGNVYFPYETVVRNVRAADPDLLVFNGDQIYENSPTEPEGRRDPGLDYLYKWYLWHWSFRELTRDAPTVVLVDDHDVYQPNVWGAGGELVEDDHTEGGYVGTAEFVNRVQHTQTAHNPDPHDPRPVERGISVYYGGFAYGGTQFAVLEDRKFKTGVDVDPREEVAAPVLLGDRQEDFLAEWAESRPAMPKICLTQTCFAAASTTPDGEPFLDPDTNGYPKLGRDRAVDLLRDAPALVLSGDQHLASLVRHGIDDPANAVVQFTIPAGGATFQRWFEPAADLSNARRGANTGDFADAFGNEFRMLAVANPKLSFAEVWEVQPPDDPKRTLYDRDQKREGYGIVRVDYDEEAFVLECWPWDADPTAADAEQYPGWPYRLSFDELDGRRT